MARYMRSYGMSNLGPPTVVLEPPIFFGPKVTLNVMLPVRSRSTVTRRRPTYALGPPAIVGAGIAWHGPGVYLTNPNFVADRNRRREAQHPLSPPTVVTPESSEVFFGPSTPPARIRPRPVTSVLRPPGVEPAEPFPGCGYPITDNFNRADQNPIRAPWDSASTAALVSNEVVPVDIGPSLAGTATYGTPVLPGDFEVGITLPNGIAINDVVQITLPSEGALDVQFTRTAEFSYCQISAPGGSFAQVSDYQAGCKIAIRRLDTTIEVWRQQPAENWQRLAVSSGADPTLSEELRISLGASLGSSLSFDDFSLCPTVHAPVAISAAYSRRGVPRSRLWPPAVVTAGQVFSGPRITLTQPQHLSRASHPRWIYPIVVLRTDAWGYIGIQLAPQRRGQPKSRLQPPAVVTPEVTDVFYGPQTPLVRIRPQRVESFLRPPALLQTNGPSQYVLTYSRRGQPTSFLRPPTDTVGSEDQGRVATHLAYSRRGRPTSFLSPPTDTVGLEDQGRVSVTLTNQHRTVARYHLAPPVVVFLAVEIYGPQVSLARIKPPPTISFLRPFTERAFEISLGPELYLAPSRFPVPKSRLEPPAVVGAIVYFGPATSLAYSRRGRPIYVLRPPREVSQPPAYQQVLPPTFAPQRRGRPTSFLNPPTVVFPFFARRADSTLAPQRRGRPTYFLSPPAILRERGQVQVNLTYSRRGRPVYDLRPPMVVRLAVEIYGPETSLAPSKRGRPISRLEPPVVVGQQPFRGIQVNLTYSRRGRTIVLRQPERVGERPGRPIQVHLTRIKPRKTRWFLRPAAVVGAAEAFFGPLVTLVRITPPPVMHFLRLTLVAFRRPHGDVCGFDIAGSFVCELQVPGSRVSGSDAAQHSVQGTSQAGSRVTGSESAGGSVSGSDRKAT